MAWNRGFRPDGLDSVTTQNEGEHHWPELCGVALMGLSACQQDTLTVRCAARASGPGGLTREKGRELLPSNHPRCDQMVS